MVDVLSNAPKKLGKVLKKEESAAFAYLKEWKDTATDNGNNSNRNSRQVLSITFGKDRVPETGKEDTRHSKRAKTYK